MNFPNFDPKELISNNKHALYFVLGALLIFGGGYATGRYLAPPETITTEKVHEVTKDKIVVQTQVQIEKVYIHDSQKDQKIHRVITENTKADGEKTKTTTEDIGTQTVVHDNTHDTEIKYVDKVIEKWQDRIVEKQVKVMTQPGWRVGASAGIAIPYMIGQGSPGVPGLHGAVLGVEADRRVVGPFWIGLRGNSQGVVGVALSGMF